MLEVSEIIYSILNASETLTSLGVDVQPIISSQDSEYPLVNYAITELAGTSKDGAFPYTISIRIYAESYKQTLQIVDAIKQAIGEAAQVGFQYNGTQAPQADVFEQLYTETNYSYKK